MFKKFLAVALTSVFAFSGVTTQVVQAKSSFPVTITNAGAKFTITKKPQRIISLSPTATESLFSIGAGPQVVAVDDQSNFPASAPKSALSGYSPNLEAIVAYRPDLVVVCYDAGNIVASLRGLGIKVLVQDAASTLNDMYGQIVQLGTVTGNSFSAGRVVARMKQDITNTIDAISARGNGMSFYHELDNTYYSITSETFIGALYKMAGLTNIADTVKDTNFGYPQLSAEFIIQKNPTLIFLADHLYSGESLATLKTRPGFSNLSAVKKQRVFTLNDDIASRWGPRTPLLLKSILWSVRQVRANG